MLSKIKQQLSNGSSSSNASSRKTRRCKTSSSRRSLKTIPELSEDDPKEVLNDHQARRATMRERLRRRRRLCKAIHLNTNELSDLLRFIYDHENLDEIEWTSDIVYTHVPRTFEWAAISESLAAWVLENAIIRSLYDHFPSVRADVQCFEGEHRVFELKWKGAEPVVPDALRDLPNLRFVEREPEEIGISIARPGR